MLFPYSAGKDTRDIIYHAVRLLTLTMYASFVEQGQGERDGKVG